MVVLQVVMWSQVKTMVFISRPKTVVLVWALVLVSKSTGLFLFLISNSVVLPVALFRCVLVDVKFYWLKDVKIYLLFTFSI